MKYIPLALATLLTVTAFIGLMYLLIQTTGESTELQMQSYQKSSHLMNVSE